MFVVLCLERGANDLHVVQMMPLPLPAIICASENPEWLSFWYWFTQVVVDKRPLNDCVHIAGLFQYTSKIADKQETENGILHQRSLLLGILFLFLCLAVVTSSGIAWDKNSATTRLPLEKI